MIDWRQFNRPFDIPGDVLVDARRYTQSKVVVDFGSGTGDDQHLDFHAHKTIRFEKAISNGCALQRGKLDESLRQLPPSERLVFVFFRVLSILSEDERLEVASALKAFRPRIDSVVVYDYTLDERKQQEYRPLDSWMGLLQRPAVEWSPQEFYHLTAENIARFVPLPLAAEKYVRIPAHKRADGRGIFLAFQRAAGSEPCRMMAKG